MPVDFSKEFHHVFGTFFLEIRIISQNAKVQGLVELNLKFEVSRTPSSPIDPIISLKRTCQIHSHNIIGSCTWFKCLRDVLVGKEVVSIKVPELEQLLGEESDKLWTQDVFHPRLKELHDVVRVLVQGIEDAADQGQRLLVNKFLLRNAVVFVLVEVVSQVDQKRMIISPTCKSKN